MGARVVESDPAAGRPVRVQRFASSAPALLLLLLLASACADLSARRAQDSRELELEAGGRIGIVLEGPGPALDASGPQPQTLALCADGLDEEEAVRVALLESRAVRAAFEELGVASADVIAAGLIANPVFSGNVAFFDSGAEFRLGLSQPLFELLWRSLRVDLAEAELEVTRARIAARLVDLAYDVRRACVRLLEAEERVRLEEQAVIAARASQELMEDLHAAGNVLDDARTREELDLERGEIDLEEARQEALERREELVGLLGLGEDPGFELVGELVPARGPVGPTGEELEECALAANLELRELDVRARGAARRGGLSSTAAKALAPSQIGVGASKELSEEELGFGPSGQVALPIFDSGAAGRAAAHARWAALSARHEARSRELRSIARRLGARAVSLEGRAARARQRLVPLRARLVLELLQQYNAMQIGAFDVLAARRAELATGREALALSAQARLTRLELERLCAGVLGAHALEPGMAQLAREQGPMVGGH